MKKLLMFFFFSVFALIPIIAQDTLPPVPGTPWEALGQFAYLIGSFPGIIVLMFFFVPFVLGGLNIQGKLLKYLVTTLSVTVLVLLAYFLQFGYLYGSYWWTIPLNVALLMLIQVGGFAWEFIRNIQDRIYEKFNPWKPTT